MKIIRNLAVGCVALISAVNAVGYTYLYKSKPTDDTAVSTMESIEETSQSDMSTEAFSEKNSEVEKYTDTTQNNTDVTQHEESRTSETTLSSVSDLNQKYKIKTIARLKDSDINSMQSFAFDLNDNVMYYIDSNTLSYYADVIYYIYKYNISSGELTLLKELSYETGISPLALTYNQFDQNVYCFSAGGINPDGTRVSNRYGLFNVESNEYTTLKVYGSRSFYFLSETMFTIEENNGQYRSKMYSYDLSDNSFNQGYIDIMGYGNIGGNIPFLYNENYYWLCLRDTESKIIETGKLFYPSNSESYGQIIGEYTKSENWCSSTVYNNEVYLMDNNFSIYKVNLDTLINQYNNKQQQNDIVNNQIINNDENNSMDALEKYIDISEIKQTGMENLTSIKYFSIVNDNNVIVFDDFDKTYKIISPNIDYN